MQLKKYSFKNEATGWISLFKFNSLRNKQSKKIKKTIIKTNLPCKFFIVETVLFRASLMWSDLEPLALDTTGINSSQN